MTAPRTSGAITFTGRPGGLTTIVPADLVTDKVVPISVSVAGKPTIYRASVRAFGSNQSEIRLRLADDTPPGTYQGEGTLGGKPRPVVIEVDAVVKVRVTPAETVVAATPAARIDFTISVLNAGNVPLDIPKLDTFDLDDEEGQDGALGRSLRGSETDGKRGVDRYFDELRNSHGGEARVLLKDGAGRLAPGEFRSLTCTLEVPDIAQEGRTYVGAWPIGDSQHVIVCDIAATVRRPKTGRKKP
ncbi:MAG: hypothetical protein H7066_06050 [Cytophagaceae bacterium]|nr:hypothetical protein [Gemmatimonadaceae bacterium]